MQFAIVRKRLMDGLKVQGIQKKELTGQDLLFVLGKQANSKWGFF